MTLFFWGGGTGDVGVAASWETLNSQSVLVTATVAPGPTDDLEANVVGTLLGSVDVQQFNIDAAVSIDATTTVGTSTVIGATDAASVAVDGGAWTETGNLFLSEGVAGALTISNGGVVTDGSEILVGQLLGAVGTLAILSGGTLTTGGFAEAIGNSLDSSGNVTVDGSGSEWTSTAPVFVGNAGNGTLTISDDATVSVSATEPNDTSNMSIGLSAGSNGFVTVTTGGVLDTGPADLTVGNSGAGTLVVQGGTVLTSNTGYGDIEAALVLGWSLAATPSALGTGVVTVDGPGAVIQSDGPIWVGQAGSGIMTIENAGTVSMTATNISTNGAVVISDNPGSTGTVSVIGATSLLNAGVGRLSIGNDGTGVLEVTQGGTAMASAAAYPSAEPAVRLGENADGTGSATIESGSTLIANGAIWVGQDGVGTLVISGGATVSAGGTNDAGDGLVVNAGTGTGDVQVDGGSLNVSDGAEINANGTLAATDSGSVVIAGALALTAGSTLSVDGTSTVVIGGSTGATAGAVAVDAGGVLGGGGLVSGNVVDNGSVTASGGTLELTGSITGSGTLHVAASATLKLDGADTGVGVVFDAPGSGTLDLATADLSGAAITGFAAGSAIQIADAVGASATIVIASGVTTLTLSTGGSLTFEGAPAVHFDGSTGVVTAGNTYNWAGGSSAFTTASNWLDVTNGNTVSTVVPGSADLAEILSVGDATITGDGSVAGLNITDLTGTLTLTGALAATSIDLDGSVVVLNGPSASLTQTVGDNLAFFVGQTASAHLLVESGATAQTVGSNDLGQPNISIGDVASGTAEVTVDGSGSMLNAGPGAVLVNGRGLLVVSDGGTVEASASEDAPGSFAYVEGSETTGAAANASATVESGGSLLADGVIAIGDTEAASLLVTDGLVQSTATAEPTDDPTFMIGDQPGANATATVAAGGTIDAGQGSVGVGMSGTGTLDVDGGTVLAANAAYSDVEAALILGWSWFSTPSVFGTGIVSVSGAGALIQADGQMLIGDEGTGVLTIADGGVVDMTGAAANLSTNSGVVLAAEVGSTGTVTIAGTGSLLNDGVGRINVGSAGTGVLMIVQGGTAQASAAAYAAGAPAVRIGFSAGAIGSVTIDGAGSDLAANGAVQVGVDGTGTLVISNGAELSAGGTNDNGEGLVVNAGTGTGDVQVDGGFLSVSDGADINANGTLAASGFGSVSIAASLSLSAGSVVAVDGTSLITLGGVIDPPREGGVVDTGFLDAGSIVVNAGASITGVGTINGNVALKGLMFAADGLLQVNGNVSDDGKMAVGAGGTIVVDGSVDATVATASATLTLGSGTVTLVTPNILVLRALNAGGADGGGATTSLDAASNLGLGDAAFVGSAGGAGNLTISVSGADQTLTGGAGGGDTFVGTAAALNGDMIENWTRGDSLDLTDVSFATAHLSYAGIASGGTLTVTDGTLGAAIHFAGGYSAANFSLLGGDGHGGTLIGWHG